MKLSWTRAAAWRVRRHHLDRRAPAGSLLSVTSRLCGLHAQVLSCAELTAWARVASLTRGAIHRALWEDRTLVKTWAMRGTLHLLPAAELPTWHAALGASPRYLRSAAWLNYFGLTLDELDQLTIAIGDALNGRVLTREQLVEEVARVSGAAVAAKLGDSSWGTILKPAAFTGRLCFGPSLGQRVQFTHPDTWLSGHTKNPKVEQQAAALEITRRFLAVNGPSTVRDLARWWGGGGITSARQWLAALGDEIAPIDLEGTEAWMLTADLRKLRDFTPKPSIRLLPGFDQYVVAASPHADHLFPDGARPLIYRPQGWISPVLLINGRMEGVWRHELKSNQLDVSITPFRKIPTWAKHAAEEEATRLATFFDAHLHLTWQN